MRLLSTLPIISTLLTPTTALLPTKFIYEFPKATWIENLAVRPCGSTLLTTLTGPDLYQIDALLPNPNPTPSLIHHFPESLATLGITETLPDEFFVILSNLTLPKVIVTPGTQRIYRVKFSFPGTQPDITLAATLPDAVLLNGLTTLNPFTLLAADSRKGVVWSINTRTGASEIKVFAKIAIKPDGTPSAGPATIIAYSPTGGSYNDFGLDFFGDAYLATGGGDSTAGVQANGKQRIVAGMMGSTEIAEPTSAQFGRTLRDRKTLYVTTAGGLGVPVNGTEVVGGQLVAVDTTGW